MWRIRNARARVGAWISGEAGAHAVGRFLTALLIVTIIAIILAIVYVGVAHGIMAIREEDVGARLRALVIIVIGTIALAAAIAVAPPLVRSLWEHVGWWTNVFRLLALIVIVFVVVIAAPLTLPQLPGGRWFGWLERSEPIESDGEPVGLIPNTPHQLPADIAAIRREAILRKYWRFLAHYGADGLRRRYDRVRQWRPLIEKYAEPAKLDPVRVAAIMMAESAGQTDITSRADARGLMQILDSNARHRADICGMTNVPQDSYDPEKNICAGVDELRGLFHVQCAGDWENTLAGYNWGIGNLSRAFGALSQRWPNTPRSFWMLWDKRDPAALASLPQWKRDRNPEGWLLFNFGKNPDETRYYVPSVLAWEYIIRYMDEHGRPPPSDGSREPPLVARHDRSAEWPEVEDREDERDDARTPDRSSRVPRSTSNVWYTARAGDSLGGVVINMLHESPDVIAELNPEIVAAELAVPPGTMIRLPEERYTFHRAAGSESYRDIAKRYSMTTAELLQWSGRWTHMQAWSASRRDCPIEGCDDERVVANAGERFLVRRRN